MRTKTITRTVVALALMATIMTTTGCKSKKGGGGGCMSLTEMDSYRNQIERMIELTK